MDKNKLLVLLTSPIALLSVGHLTADLYSGFIIPILPYIAKKLEISLPLAALVISFTGLTSSFLQPIYGYFSDKISKRFFVVWGLVIASIFVSLTGVAYTYLILVFVVIMGNIGVGLYHPQATAYTGKFKSDNKGLSMGIFVAGGIIGYALGPMTSSLIVEFLGLEWTPIAAIPGLIMAIAIYFYLPKITFEKQHSSFATIFANLNSKKHIMIPIVLIVIIRSFMLMSMSTFYPFEWEDNLGYSVLTVGFVMTLFSIASGISTVIGGNLAGRYGERKMLLLSFILPLPLLLGALHLMQSNGIMSFALYIIGGALLESTIAVNIIIAQRTLPENIGIASGITAGFCWGIAGFLMFPLGMLISYFGTFSVITVVLLLALIAMGIIFTIPEDTFNDQKL